MKLPDIWKMEIRSRRSIYFSQRLSLWKQQVFP